MGRLALVAVLLVAWPAIAGADGGTYAALGEEIARSWTPRPDGSYPPVRAGNYADAMLGDVQVRTGLRTGDQRLLRDGVRSVTHACRHPIGHRPFEMLGIADAYLGSGRSRAPVLVRARAQWRRCLAGYRPYLAERWREGRYVNNWQLVEWAARVLIGRAGINSSDRGTWASGAWDERALRTVGGMPRLAIAQGGCFLGDPGGWPFAYHALSAALLRIARHPLADCAAEGVRAIVAPDGDIAYSGRSYEQSFAVAASGYVLLRSGHPGEAANAYQRLRSFTHGRVRITPCVCDLDHYVNVPTYNGLTAFFLLKVGDVEPATPTFAAGTSTSRLFRITRSATRFTAEMLVGARARFAPGDGRYRGGIVRDKELRNGVWVDLVPDLRSYGPTD